MNQANNPSAEIIAQRTVEALRTSIRGTWRLHEFIEKDRICFCDFGPINISLWTYVLSFMTRKICALFLGETDFDREITDLKFSFIKNEAADEN